MHAREELRVEVALEGTPREHLRVAVAHACALDVLADLRRPQKLGARPERDRAKRGLAASLAADAHDRGDHRLPVLEAGLGAQPLERLDGAAGDAVSECASGDTVFLSISDRNPLRRRRGTHRWFGGAPAAQHEHEGGESEQCSCGGLRGRHRHRTRAELADLPTRRPLGVAVELAICRTPTWTHALRIVTERISLLT